MFIKITKPFFRFIALILYRVKKINEDNIPKEGPVILCGNHVHGLDAPVVIVCTKRHVKYMAKIELFKNKSLAFLMNKYGTFAVRRGTLDRESLKNAFEVIEEGNILGMFPEGTRKGIDKKVKIKNGAAYIASLTGVPIVPVGIIGSFKPFTKVVLKYGKPISVIKFDGDKPDKEILDQISLKIMEAIQAELTT